jgi:hypothetical protein
MPDELRRSKGWLAPERARKPDVAAAQGVLIGKVSHDLGDNQADLKPQDIVLGANGGRLCSPWPALYATPFQASTDAPAGTPSSRATIGHLARRMKKTVRGDSSRVS